MTPTPEKPRKQRPLRLTLALLWKHMASHRWLYIFGVTLGIADALCQTSVPLFSRYIINGIQTSAVDFMQNHFIKTLLAAIGITIVFFPAAYFFHVFMQVAIARTARELRTSLYVHIQQLSADFFQRTHIGEINTRLNADLEGVINSITATMPSIWSIVVLVQSITMMFLIHVRLACFMTGFVVIVFIATQLFLPIIRSMNRNVRDAMGELSATITEYIGIQDLIRSFSREDFADKKVDGKGAVAQKKQEYLAWRQNLYGDFMQVLIIFIAPMTLLFLGGWFLTAKDSNLKYGDLIAFWGYWIMLGNTVRYISSMFTQLFAGLASSDRIFDFFEETPLISDSPTAKEIGNIQGEITFDSVIFTYPAESNRCVLDSFSMNVAAGQKIGLVGLSGAGKTTILYLILRFYDPKSGSISIDGCDLRSFTQRSLRSKIGFVMQESIFFSGTIAENLRLAREDATEEQMRQALQSANALDFIDQMGGLHAVLGERGVKLSGGQKQRLSIARVFLKDPPIVLLDEATSSLDSLSERLVQEAMDRLMAGRTTIIIAHRISTIIDANTIFILKKGKLEDRGTHSELCIRNDLYHKLCQQQGLLKYVAV